MNKDRLIAFFSFLIGVLSLLVSIWPSFVQSQALGSLYNFSYWLFFLVRYNLYLIFFPVALVLYAILWKSRTDLFQKSRKVFFFLSIFFVINSVCSSVLLYFRDYSRLTQKGFEYENDGYLLDALQLFNHATMYDRHQKNRHVRRVYNSLILSWSLYKAYERQKEDRLSIDATENLCKATLLNKDFSSEIISVRNLQQKLDIKYAEAIRRFRKGGKKYFIDTLGEIDSEFHNYGYSKSILDALSNTHAMDTKKAGTDYLIAATEFRILMDEFLLLEKRTPDEVVKKLTQEFQIDALYNLRIEKRAELALLNETFTENANEWEEQDDKDALIKIDAGKFVFENRNENEGYQKGLIIEIDEKKNFSIEVTMTWLKGSDNGSYGIIWGNGNNGYQHEFSITNDGYFEIESMLDSSFSTPATVEESNTIQTRSTNQLMIEKVGNRTEYYINNIHVKTLPFEGSYSNFVGFIVFGRQRIAFDNFIIKQSVL